MLHTAPTVDPQSAPIEQWDDAQVIAALRDPGLGLKARTELEHRQRFEAAWLGEWESGPRLPLTERRVDRSSVDAWRQQRDAFQTLLSLSRSASKTVRDSALFLLKRDHHHSVS